LLKSYGSELLTPTNLGASVTFWRVLLKSYGFKLLDSAKA